MFKLIHKNRKGFSLIELIVAITILGLVIGLAGEILYQLTNFANMSSHRWEIQSAVQLAYNKFETNRDSLVNAYQADLLYDPLVANGIEVEMDEDGNMTGWKWKGLGTGRYYPYTMPNEGTVDNKYTYIFSTPAYTADGVELGYFLFIREFGKGNSELFLDAEGFGEVPVKIVFTIATDNPAYNFEDITNGSGETVTDASGSKETTLTRKDDGNLEYVSHAIGISIQSGLEDVTEYKVDTKYALENISANNKKLNYDANGLIYESGWKDEKAAAGPAGWSVESINDTVTDSDKKGYPSTNQTKIASTGETVTVTTIENEANIMRFISPMAHFAQGSLDDNVMGIDLASCISTYAMNGSDMADTVLDNLRNFRDNVLRGTELGDWFIDVYYNKLSPFLVENTAFLKPVYQAVLIPVSYVCDFIAKL